MELNLDTAQILTLDEIAAVLTRGEKQAARHPHVAQNLIIFRLAVGAGLRASEIAGLELRDLHTDSAAPYIAVRREVAKRRKPRKVPLAWDEGTLLALRAWKAKRLAAGADLADPVVCVLQRRAVGGGLHPGKRSQAGKRLTRSQVARKFKAVLRPLPAERRAELHTHSGRHTYASYMVREHPLAAVRNALGHASIATTAVYLHADPADFGKPGSVFKTDRARRLGATTPAVDD